MDNKGLMVLSLAILVSSLILAGGFYFGLSSASQNMAAGLAKIQITNGGGTLVAPQQPTQLQPTAAPTPQVNFEDLKKTYVAADGKDDAKVTIVEFSDFQCPFCRLAYEDSLKQLKTDYVDTGKVRLLFRNFPLPFHPMAQITAEGGLCAAEQGKFWPYHDTVFDTQHKQDVGGQYGTVTYTKDDLINWAAAAGLDKAKFSTCLNSGKYTTKVREDLAAGEAAGVSGTPTFFINGQQLVGAQPYASFKAAIEAALSAA